MSYLIVVAHPDDEVLGAGATIYNLTKNGYEVNVCILSSEVRARNNRPDDDEFYKNIEASSKILGINKMINGNFPNIELNTVPHLQLVQFIEKAILDTKAEVVITHHPSDVNNDHLHTALACQAAVRIFQRKKNVGLLKEFLYMEVASSTDWNLNTTINGFKPNMFFEIGETGLEKKIEALSEYYGVIKEYPHPRSIEALKALAVYRGAQSNMRYAEAFESVFRSGF